MINLIALEDFMGAEDGIHVKSYIKKEKISTNNKEYADLLVSKGHAKLEAKRETKVVKPTETKTATIETGTGTKE